MHDAMNDNHQPPKGKRWVNAVVFFCAFVIAFLILEIAVRRIYPPHIGVPSSIANYAAIPKPHDRVGLVVFNEELGWVNNPGASGYGQFHEYLSFDSQGFRNNDNKVKVKDKPVILAMGDSFTMGAEVGNAETWPARLEFKSGVRVLNGGVSGYGLDQMLTRTKSILQKRNVDVVIVAFFVEDIYRVGEKKQYVLMKPYYSLENHELILHKVKAEDYPRPDCFKKIFGYSYAVHLIMSKLFGDYWSKSSIDSVEYADIDEAGVNYKIIDEFAGMAKSGKAKYIVFAILPGDFKDVSLTHHPLTDYISNTGRINNRVLLMDLQSKMRGNPSFFNDRAKGYHGHFSIQGNEFVSQEIESFLQAVRAY
jgi:hypothetical protein